MFCWNVKCYSGFNFEDLVAAYNKDEGPLSFQELLRGRRRYEEVHDKLWSWAVDSARTSYVDGEDGSPGDCANTTLWCGTDVRVRYEFMGRSGGWLVMTEFMDHLLCANYFTPWSLTFRDLRALCEMVNFVDRNLSGDAVTRELEHQAAWIVFNS
jgi:hypothetical protein